MSTVVERLELLLVGNAKDAIGAIRQTQAAAVDLDSSTGQVQKRMSFLGAAAQTAGQHIQQNLGVYGVAAAGALTAAGAASVKEFTSLADKVRDFSRASGANADTSSRLVAIFDDLQVGQDKADSGFFRLNRTLSTNADALDQYGVKVRTAKDGNLDIYGTLLSIADAYKSTEDSGQRAALVQEAFGRGGKDLIPILEQGRAGIEKLFENVPDGQILSQDQIDNARKWELAVDNLKDSIQELKVAAGSEIVSGLTGFVNYTGDAIRTTNEARRSVMDYADGIAGPLSDAFVKSIPVIGPTVGVMKDVGSALGFGKSKSDEYADSQKRVSEAQAEVVRLSADETTKQSELHAAQRELTAAKNEFEGVSRRVAAALVEETSKYAENRAEAQSYINAQLGVAGAQLNVESATARYNQSLDENGAGAIETRQAAFNLTQQYVALGAATEASALQAGKSQGEAAQAQVDALSWVAGTLAPGSPLRVWLDDYINRLETGIPKNITTRLTLQQAVQGFMTPGVDAEGNPVLETFADGGVVPGAPGARRIIEAHGGEAIFNGDQLRALGAAGVAVSGGRAASAGGGGTVMFVIDGHVLGRASLDAINEAAKAGGVIPAEAIIT